MSKKLTSLSDLIDEISMGPFGSDIKVENFVSIGVPVLNGSNLTGFRLVEDKFKYVTEEKSKTYKKAIARRGDIVVTHRGTLGQISFIPENSKYDSYVISQSQFRVRLKTEKAIPAFFVYYFHTEEGQKRLLSFKSHVGVPALAQATTNFRQLEIPLPDISSQKKIAAVLSALDAKIDCNNRLNAELETMAKTLYDYWFVQFDFPDANDKPYKSSGGKMVYNATLKREIPAGWEVSNLSDLVELIKGNVSPSDVAENTPYVGLEHIGRKTIALSDWGTSDSAASDKTVFKKNDILFGKIRPYFHKVTVAPFDGITSTDTIIMRPKKRVFFGLVLETIFADEFVDAATQSSTGSKMPRADWSVLRHYKVPVSDTNLLNSFNAVFEKALEKIYLSETENKKLIELRDWLLPMLMNGQVTVA
ncbi:restriction endonuclease subunit S [Nitrosomonas sp.]|uniref:restriction endonuclease subunit S n=1 Tax=Nitrosomonas sp. TaxID=42353 RepID=UPI00374DBD24